MCVCRSVARLAVVRAYAHLSVCVPVCCSVVASPWSVFLFSGSAASAGGQALHHASQRRAAPERPGQTEEALRRGDRPPAGTQRSFDLRVESHSIRSAVCKKNLEVNPLRPVCPPPQHSAELVKTVASRDDEYVSVKDLSDKINRALVAAKKDNDFIYHDRVPEVKDLEPIGKAALVKATTITPPLSQKFTGEIRRRSTQVLAVKRAGHNSDSVSQFLL